MLLQLATRFLSQTVAVDKLTVTCEDIFGSVDYVCTFQPLISWLATGDRKRVRILRYRLQEQIMVLSHMEDSGTEEIVTLEPPRTALLVWCKCEDEIYALVSQKTDASYKALTVKDAFKLRYIARPERLFQVGNFEQPNACAFFTCHAPNLFNAPEFVIPVPLKTLTVNDADADLSLLIFLAKENGVFDQNTAD